MAKILLVEDDKSLREIYSVRLQAEGYEIVSAGDGEEALAMAIKERPDLIISDVMMPKISGFDMLDILRSTTETKGVRVIMMTALSSDDQRARGEALGADRYLVKSQVGIEDVVRTVHDVLTDTPGASSAQPVATPDATTDPIVAPTLAPVADVPVPDVPVMPVAMPDPIAPAPVAQPAADLSGSPFGTNMMTETPNLDPPTPADFSGPTIMPPSDPAMSAPAADVPVMPVAMPDPIAPALVPQPVPTLAPAFAPMTPPLDGMIPPTPGLSSAPSSTAVINTPPEIPVAPMPVAAPPSPATPLPAPTAPFSSPAPASLADRVISPLPSADNLAQPSNMDNLISQELQNAGTPAAQTPPPPAPPVPPMPGQQA